jgi:hypothetical protein
MLGTADLYRLVTLAESNQWRLVLVGDPRQLHAVGRGGLFDELCANGRVEHLQQLHRFTHRWEADASLQLRVGDPHALDAYEAHGRIIAGALEHHLTAIGDRWIDNHDHGRTVALVASSNEHVDALNCAIQSARYRAGHLDVDRAVEIADAELACVGDVVATRRNQRQLVTSNGEPVRNRDTWTITDVGDDGTITVTHHDGHGHVTLPADYIQHHVRLGYAATEHGYQSDTVTVGVELADQTTTRRGLYVGVTRGAEENWIHVITDSHDITEARDVLEQILAVDRVDIPALTQRQHLAHRAAPARFEPRCEIPEFFEPLRANIAAELHDTRIADGHAVARRQPLVDALTTAEQRFVTADQHCRPYQQRADTANAAVADAWQQRHDAQVAAQHAKFGHRRQACVNLAIADQRLDAANTNLASQVETAVPPVAAREQARQQLADARRALRRSDRIDHWAERGHDLRTLEQLAAAIDAWHDWAQGRPVNTDQINATIRILNSHTDGIGWAGVQQLAEPITQWGIRHGIGASPVRPIPQTLEIDVGLGL